MIRNSASVAGVLTICLLSAGGIAQASSVPTFSGPGVPSPGYPDFWGSTSGATLTQNGNGTFTLSVIGSSAGCSSKHGSCSSANFNFPGAAYAVGNETLTITANFSSKGVFTSGTYDITGSLPAWTNPTSGTPPSGVTWGAQGTEVLLTANLTNDAVDSTDEALGFTEVITGGWADQRQFTSGSPESVWLYAMLSGGNDNMRNRDWNAFLAQLVAGRGLQANSFAALGSVATVPLPGAVWLFGSGVLGLVGLARRRQVSATGRAR